MNDKELLLLAAKSANIETPDFIDDDGSFVYYDQSDRDCATTTKWNPLCNYGDTMKLAIELMFKVDIRKTSVTVDPYVFNENSQSTVEFFDDNYRSRAIAVCRAITRAAAEIGRSL